MAATQLPATRTTTRAHGARSATTGPASSATTTNSALATPAMLSAPDCTSARPAPCIQPGVRPTSTALPITTGSGNCQSVATTAPSTIVSPQVSQVTNPGGTSPSPTVMPVSHATGSTNNTQRPHCAPR